MSDFRKNYGFIILGVIEKYEIDFINFSGFFFFEQLVVKFFKMNLLLHKKLVLFCRILILYLNIKFLLHWKKFIEPTNY